MTETLLYAAILAPCLIIAIVFHEVAHGLAALALGDPTAREQRRLSLNPLRHIDPVGTLLVPGALALLGGPVFGWAKPVPINAQRLNNPRFGMMAVAAAGPGMNLLLALVAAVLLGVVGGLGLGEGTAAAGIAATLLTTFILINIFLALFNLLPIPPFDGSHIVGGLLPRSMAAQWQKLQQVGMLLLVALIAATWAFPGFALVEHTVLPPVLWLEERYFALVQWIAGGIAR
jgi:Zn-dependent protease